MNNIPDRLRRITWNTLWQVPVAVIIKSFFALLLLFHATRSEPVVPAITVRVDTANADVQPVFDLLKDYLNSRPDSLYDNPFWSDAEKREYAEPYCARTWIFLNPWIVHSFPPRILSIEKDNDCYSCRILYYAENLEAAYAASNPWALQRLYVCRENGSWKLFDPIRIITSSWHRTTIGKIEFVYGPDHVFDAGLAEKTSFLVDSLASALQISVDFGIQFYITRNVDELDELVGLDFTLNVSAGRAITANHMILTATGTEWYPHEIVHVVINSRKAHYLISEGIATLVGGTGEKSFADLVKELDVFWGKHDTLTLQQLIEQPYQAGSLGYYYTTGAVLCKAALDKGGTTALKKLLDSSTTDEELYRVLEIILGTKKDEITGFIRKKTKVYSQN